MEKLYTYHGCDVILLPEVPELSILRVGQLSRQYRFNAVPYFDRGWCFFEFSLAESYELILARCKRDPLVVDLLKKAPSSPDDFKKEFAGKKFTYCEDSEKVSAMYQRIVDSGRATCDQLLRYDGYLHSGVIPGAAAAIKRMQLGIDYRGRPQRLC
eukprot:gnl/TRDRNA2_/TRDRNA2_176237_c2_seq23.p1 gnl/TRDRNA2_/TRDRNA2_176237_c2~~gnl/TRDRNA2_/TRDRNA2_176237_c2_seq23.p1  ORF type:complete len:156 (-),score=19.50 gnl/TRDRNA2_/TRDRNA2_176237_c2_seq23:647-1114(-)